MNEHITSYVDGLFSYEYSILLLSVILITPQIQKASYAIYLSHHIPCV